MKVKMVALLLPAIGAASAGRTGTMPAEVVAADFENRRSVWSRDAPDSAGAQVAGIAEPHYPEVSPPAGATTIVATNTVPSMMAVPESRASSPVGVPGIAAPAAFRTTSATGAAGALASRRTSAPPEATKTLHSRHVGDDRANNVPAEVGA
jgi:hypothetical protein